MFFNQIILIGMKNLKLGDALFTIAKGDPETIESVMASYNLGKIHGIRQERARRRK